MTRYAARGPLVLLATVLLTLTVVSCAAKAVNRPFDDATISTRVKTALLNDPQLSALGIDVSSSQGVVTLSGTARSRDDEQRAVQLAKGVQGVKDVRSQIKVGG